GEYLYAIQIETNPDEGFNLCPADICQVDRARALVGSVAAMPLVNGVAEGEACDFGAGAVAVAPTATVSAAGNGRSNGTPVSVPVVPVATEAPVAKRPL